MLHSHNPGVRQCVVLVEDVLRKTGRTVRNNFSSVNLHTQGAGIQNQETPLFVIQNAGLFHTAVRNHRPRCHRMPVNNAVIRSNAVRSGLLRLFQKPVKIIGHHPVVRVNKCNPFALCSGNTKVLGSSLMAIPVARNHADPVRMLFLQLPQNLQ